MSVDLHVLTGASRGLGAAMAEQLLAPGVTLLGISRGVDPELAARARAAGATLLHWPHDLADTLPLAERLDAWLSAFDPQHFDSASLINNAAMVGPVGPIDGGPREALSRALRVGLEAPLLLGAAFLRATGGWRARRRVLNISSGLGRRAMAGSAAYCAVKGGLDHLSRAMALDEALRPNGARIVSLAPGVIDTGMQAELRAADPAGFPDQARFLALKANDQLSPAGETARQVIAWLHRPDFGDEVIADVRQG